MKIRHLKNSILLGLIIILSVSVFATYNPASFVLSQNSSSGNIGIGTTLPTQKLDINGSINISSISGILYSPQICLGGVCQTSWSQTTCTDTTTMFNATGGTITTILVNGVNYTVHTFTTNGTFASNFNGTVEYLVIAGGGSGGGRYYSGGGGAGGFRTGNLTINSTNYTIIIGSGGSSPSHVTPGNPGGNSTFSTITSIGGGGGSNSDGNAPSGTFGSGGGAGGGGGGAFVGAAGTLGQGNTGGSKASASGAAGGGGAGGVGLNSTTLNGSDGGVGINSSINGTLVTYAGGGGGGAWGPDAIGGNGGSGGGGHGGATTGNSGLTSGIPNTGGGGGGVSGYNNEGDLAGTGGSGIVIVRYVTTTTVTTCTGTGWSVSSSQVSLANTTNNFSVNTLFIDNTNTKVGIGTTSPTSTLHVVGNINATTNISTPKLCLSGDCQTTWPNNESASIASIGNWTADKSGYNTTSQLNNVYYAIGNPFGFYNSTNLPYQNNAAGWSNASTLTSTSLNVSLIRSNLTITNGTFSVFTQANNVNVTTIQAGYTTNTGTGGTITTIIINGTNYTVHTFTSNGTFTSSFNGTAEVLVVAGGAGGSSGGGGAGGLIYNSSYSIMSQSYNITIGNGGNGGVAASTMGANGATSSFATLTAVGGGGGAYTQLNGSTGGSGGGGGSVGNWDTYGGNGTSNQGNSGGGNNGFRAGPYPGGGGGGAGSSGSGAFNSSKGGDGGNGSISSLNGTSVYYAGGGGGGIWWTGAGYDAGIGGFGGGGNGSRTANGWNGTNGTGGGGGGSHDTGTGGRGGSGIVIIRYQTINTMNTTVYVNVSTNITSTFTVNNIGNVGIGTTTPNNKLDINGTDGAYAGIYLNSAIPSLTPYTLYNSAGTLIWNGFALTLNSSIIGTTNYLPKFTSSNSLGNSVLYESSGNIGIGTTSPNQALHVIGNINATGNISSPQICLNGNCQTTWPNNDSAAIASIGNWTADKTNYNTTSQLNNVYYAIGNTFGFYNSTNLPYQNNAAGWSNNSQNTTTLLNVGIGTTTPNSLLTVDGAISLKNISTPSATSGYGKFYFKIYQTNISVAVNATGGTITTILVNGTNYTVHTFTTNGTFTPNFNGTVEYLVVAGGGGGGGVNTGADSGAGGGGAGGFRTGSYSVISTSAVNLTIGNGGVGSSGGNGTSGANSSFGTIISKGGGGGGGGTGGSYAPGVSGGSGGGASGYGANPTLGGNGTTNQGNNGGQTDGGRCGAGGGGAGTNGGNGVQAVGGGGAGGNGSISSITGSNSYYAGGGGGGCRDSYTPAGVGGLGGGGNGSNSSAIIGWNGTVNTGGGGGGSGSNSSGAFGGTGGNGGSGIVIIRYLTFINVSTTTSGLFFLNPEGIETQITNSSGSSVSDSDWIISGNNQYSGVSGNVGIGTTNPTSTLHVVGNANITGDLYLGGNLTDLSEYVFAVDDPKPGDVVVAIGSEKIMKSNKSYDKHAIGVITTAPAATFGAGKGNVRIAISGRVPVKVTNENGNIEAGDLLTTSSTSGYAMRCVDNSLCFGKTIGKALTSMEDTNGSVIMMVALN